MDDSELLKFAGENGMIDTRWLRGELEAMRKKEALARHNYPIQMGADGRWFTYFSSPEPGRKPRMVRKTNKADIEKMVCDYWAKNQKDYTVRDVFYEDARRRLELDDISEATYKRNEETFRRFYGDFGKKRIKNISPQDFADFLDECVSRYSLNSKAFSGLKYVTRYILRYAYRNSWISYVPDAVFEKVTVSKRKLKSNKRKKEDYEEVFDEEEMGKLIGAIMENQDLMNLGILLMLVTGIRVGELVALKHSDILPNTVSIRRTESAIKQGMEDGKTTKYLVKPFPKSEAGWRDVVVPKGYEWLLRKIGRHNPNDEYLFMVNGRRLHTTSFRSRLYRICRNNGIYRKSPHKLRKTYGSILMDSKVDSRFVTDQMGHADIAVSEGSYHRNRKDIARKQEILDSIPELQGQRGMGSGRG